VEKHAAGSTAAWRRIPIFSGHGIAGKRRVGTISKQKVHHTRDSHTYEVKENGGRGELKQEEGGILGGGWGKVSAL
jgi:hypothetical protein